MRLHTFNKIMRWKTEPNSQQNELCFNVLCTARTFTDLMEEFEKMKKLQVEHCGHCVADYTSDMNVVI